MRYRDNEKDSLTRSAHLETIDVLKDMITPKKIGEIFNVPVFEEPEIHMTPIELAVAISDNSIKKWQVYQAIYSEKIGPYLIGKAEPILHRCGSAYVPEGGRRIFGDITPKKTKAEEAPTLTPELRLCGSTNEFSGVLK